MSKTLLLSLMVLVPSLSWGGASSIGEDRVVSTGVVSAVIGGLNPSIVSPGNTTSIPLLAGTSFTGTAEIGLGYSVIVVTVFSDQDSAIDGLMIQQSPDGTNWDNEDNYNITANEGKYTTIGVMNKFFRVIYTNGGSSQSVFRLQTILHYSNVIPSAHRMVDDIPGQSDGEIVAAVVFGESTSGELKNIQVNPDGKLQVEAEMVASNTTLEAKRFVASTGQRIKVGATEDAQVLIVNLSTSTKNLIVDRQFFTSIDSGVNLLFRFYHKPVVSSSGTTITPQNALLGNGPIPHGQMYFQPTVTSNGQIVNTYQARDNIIIDETNGRLIIPPGEKILITVESSGNNKKWSYSMAWIEENL